jgi:tRNA1Val (adenine37-N6)-methyltransferase
MPNSHFSFKQFTIHQEKCAFRVGTDGVLLGAAAGVDNTRTILDVGSGTGLLALMLAQRSDAMITAIEPDELSFQQCCENVRDSGWRERITVLNLRLQDIDPQEYSFDLVVSNPPYFNDSLRNEDERKSAARHSFSLPHNELISCSARLLNEGGRLEVIMPYDEGNILIAEAAESGLYCNRILKIRPNPASEIRRLILSFSRRRTRVSEKFLTIERGARFDFTREYIELTRDFYLKF